LLASRTPAQQAGKASVPATADAANDDGLQPNERSLAKSLSAEKVRKDAKDIFLIEAAHILSDQISATEAELSPSVGAI
jgi:carboxyl-terminal processing protease